VWGLCLAGLVWGAGCSSQRAARIQGRETAEQLADRARAAADRGDKESAEVLLTAAVNHNPNDCETRLELSEMLLEHGSLAVATNHLRRLVDQNPDDPRAHVKLARALYLQQDVNGAERNVDRALELDPGNPQAWLLRARIENSRQNDSPALAACYRVLAADAEDLEAKLLAAEIHLRQGEARQTLPLARSVMDSGSSCPRQQATAAWLAGRCYAQDGRWSEAASALSAAIRERAKATAADWYQVAYAKYRAGDLPGSREAVQSALKIAPNDAESLALARLLEVQESRKENLTGSRFMPSHADEHRGSIANMMGR
jgi:tetratricopeptide (TPR) repeat protein